MKTNAATDGTNTATDGTGITTEATTTVAVPTTSSSKFSVTGIDVERYFHLTFILYSLNYYYEIYVDQI